MRTMPPSIRKKKHPNPPHPITDHALVRFIARNGILDISALRAYLYTPGLKAVCRESRANSTTVYYTENGLNFCVINGQVVTILVKYAKE